MINLSTVKRCFISNVIHVANVLLNAKRSLGLAKRIPFNISIIIIIFEKTKSTTSDTINIITEVKEEEEKADTYNVTSALLV